MTPDYQLCVLGSGSKGNCTFLQAGSVPMLIDAGLRSNDIRDRLSEIGTRVEDIRHLFITHEHEDHIKGLRRFCKKFTGRIHLNQPTYERIRHLIPDHTDVHIMEEAFTTDGVDVQPFALSHDAAAAVGFTFWHNQKKVTIATDTGCVSPVIEAQIKGSEAVVLESNHDERMLMIGNYPPMLKRRIASRYGHLSNRQAGELMENAHTEQTKYLFLAHLSENNNAPHLAMDSMYAFLDGARTMPELVMTHPDRISSHVTL